MPLGTLGTATTTSLPAIQFSTGIRVADFIQNLAALNSGFQPAAWGQATGAQAAGASWLASATSITMSGPAPYGVSPGQIVFDTNLNVQIGIIASWTGTTLTLVSGAPVASSTTGDKLVFFAGSMQTFNPSYGASVSLNNFYIPDRGILRLYDNDIVAYDPSTGDFVVLHYQTANGPNWVFTPDT